MMVGLPTSYIGKPGFQAQLHFVFFIFFFLKDLFIYLKISIMEREEKTERQILHSLFAPQMVTAARAGPNWSQETGSPRGWKGPWHLSRSWLPFQASYQGKWDSQGLEPALVWDGGVTGQLDCLHWLLELYFWNSFLLMHVLAGSMMT